MRRQRRFPVEVGGLEAVKESLRPCLGREFGGRCVHSAAQRGAERDPTVSFAGRLESASGVRQGPLRGVYEPILGGIAAFRRLPARPFALGRG